MLKMFFNKKSSQRRRSAELMLLGLVLLVAGLVHCGGNGKVNNEELYRILNVPKTATTKEIRVSFKKIALIKHPDKNKSDPKANEEFIKINRAYEILKDDELRKKYDTYGEDGLKENHQSGQQYQSWNFYHQKFGIYDDDPEVITLTRSDFVQMVESNTETVWFINFYSTQCSHCHELAPAWRDLAKQLDGVVKIGAVNCMDDWQLCNQQQIQSFPSLIMFPKRTRFGMEKTLENLLTFALSFTQGNVIELTNKVSYNNQLSASTNPWLISFCLNGHEESSDDTSELNYELNCLEHSVALKLAIILKGLVNVGTIDCNNPITKESICDSLRPKRAAPLQYFARLPDISQPEIDLRSETIQTSDYKQIAKTVLTYLPEIILLDGENFENILANLRNMYSNEKPWLIEFVNEYKPNQENELKKLPALLGLNYNFGRVDCSALGHPHECLTRFQITKYPTFVLFKSASLSHAGPIDHMLENWYEINYSNRQTPDDLTAFVIDNAYTTVRTLKEFEAGLFLDETLRMQNKIGFFVDFFAPWCPPCMNLLPEFRKAAKHTFNVNSVAFGTVDCTLNQRVCEQFNIRSYPTTIFFYNSGQHNYVGQHSSDDISDFIQDIINPTVVTLTYDTFNSFVKSKPVGKLWLVDFYASWCGPCQQLAPEWRKLGKRLNKDIASIGQVDCVVEQRLCSEQGITSYPNIRLYPASSFGINQPQQYQGWMRDVHNLYAWAANFFPTKTFALDYNNFERLILNNNQQQPWLVDFYAPWCGHCNVFAPKFEIIAEKLEGKVKLAKVNCQEQQYLCQRIGITGFPSIVFYPLPNREPLPWNAGQQIYQYEVDTLIYEVQHKLNSYGYGQANINYKTEL